MCIKAFDYHGHLFGNSAFEPIFVSLSGGALDRYVALLCIIGMNRAPHHTPIILLARFMEKELLLVRRESKLTTALTLLKDSVWPDPESA